MYARWAAETWGYGQEVYNMGNKLKQARDRAFLAARASIKHGPNRNKWRLMNDRMIHLPSDSFIEALPVSDEGEAGGNPSLTVWTELWGFKLELARRFWDEMQPVATRPLSQRFIDTYAGYAGESELLQDLWDRALKGDRLHETLPIYGVPAAGLIAYIDTGPAARRMYWQTPEYYARQEALERPVYFRRLHLNEWAESHAALIPMALWDGLQYHEPNLYPRRIGGVDTRPLVTVAVDASVSGDSTAIVAVMKQDDVVIELATWVFEPPRDGKLDYEVTIRPALEQMFRQYRVGTVAYDEYQLHDFMTQYKKQKSGVDFVAFTQGDKRLAADTALLNRLRQGRLLHSGDPELREHIANADAEEKGDKGAIRIVKRNPDKKIDAVICLSMAAYKISTTERKPGMVRTAAEGLFDR
jgi:hypothetical protein